MTSVVFAQTAFAVNTIAVESSNLFIIFSLFIALYFFLSTSPDLQQGACGSCPSSTMTLKMGIERKMRESIPEVSEVVQVL